MDKKKVGEIFKRASEQSLTLRKAKVAVSEARLELEKLRAELVSHGADAETLNAFSTSMHCW